MVIDEPLDEVAHLQREGPLLISGDAIVQQSVQQTAKVTQNLHTIFIIAKRKLSKGGEGKVEGDTIIPRHTAAVGRAH